MTSSETAKGPKTPKLPLTEPEPLAWVENGRVRVTHPPGGPYPVLVPADGVELLVNGTLREGPTPVKQGDVIEIRPLVAQSPGSWRLEVAPDGLAAKLSVRPQVAYRRKIPDLPPAAELKIVPQTRELASPPLTLEELLEELRRRGICHGIDWCACKRATSAAEEGKFVVARATPPVPGEPARLEILFPEAEKVPVVVGPEEQADFRRRFTYTSVSPGTVLARKIPPKAGLPGRDIYGGALLPPEPPDFKLEAGPGVMLDEGGLEARACLAGRPYVQRGRGTVRVGIMPVLEHEGDVDLTCGSITFQGDVRVGGSVQEGMAVKATGRVEIFGDVSSATVEAGGSVLIGGNVLSAVVIAGGRAALFREITALLENLYREVSGLVCAAEQVMANPAFKTADLKAGIGPLVCLLLEGKFQNLPALVRALGTSIGDLPPETVPEELTVLWRKLESLFLLAPLRIREGRDLRELAARIGDFVRRAAEDTGASGGEIVVRYALGSTMAATGSIRVLGAGCYNSTVRAGKDVFIRGVCRGGEVRAQGEVTVGELGSPAGIMTRVLVSAGGRVRIGLARENALVQIGGSSYRFEREERGVELRLGKEGRVELRYPASSGGCSRLS